MTKKEQRIVAFLPCRKGSQRVPRKNLRPFAGYEHGLVEIKLRQLLECQSIDEVVLSTNDEEILTYARTWENDSLLLHRRSDDLCSSETSTDTLVGHAASLIPDAHILWTHVTSPFVSSRYYSDIIRSYLDSISTSRCDSLMTTTLIKGFIWDSNGPVNYDRQQERWPRTQTLRPLHEVNSAAFIADTSIFHKFNDRIGSSPMLYSLSPLVAMDIDWEHDFKLAEQMLMADLVTV